MQALVVVAKDADVLIERWTDWLLTVPGGLEFPMSHYAILDRAPKSRDEGDSPQLLDSPARRVRNELAEP